MPQGPTATGYAGKGLRDALTLIDNNYPLNIWKLHLCGALDKYYDFMTPAQDCQQHALPMAVVTALMVYLVWMCLSGNIARA
jgi:hypothetical protein